MRKITIVLFVLLVPLLAANKCDDDGGVDADSPKSICKHLFKLCGNDLFEGDVDVCVDTVSPLETCRKECAADQKTCETVDQCLFWNIGYDGEGDDYCMGGGSSSYSSLDDCVAGECSSEYSKCNSNYSCTGIFDDCLSGCADWECLELCANTGYADGINDFNTLWTCLTNSCSEWM